MGMLDGAKRISLTALLLREVRGLRRDLRANHAAMSRIAEALEAANAHRWPQKVASPVPGAPAVEINFVDDDAQRRWMDAELRLTAAAGRPPTEDEILQEFERATAPTAMDPNG